MTNPDKTSADSTLLAAPLLPLRDVVVYPHMVIPLFVGRERSINALEAAMNETSQIFLVAQKNPAEDRPDEHGLFATGTLANILQLLKLPDGTVKALIEGCTRAKVQQFYNENDYLSVSVNACVVSKPEGHEADALMRILLEKFEQYVKLNKKIPPEMVASLSGVDDPDRMADTIIAHIPLKLTDKQLLLEMNDVAGRIEKLLDFLESEIDIQRIEKRIRGRAKKQVEKSQREYYLTEQLKAVQKELGEMDETANEVDELEKKITTLRLTHQAKKKALSELKKLKMMSPMSAEANVVRSYIECLTDMPWKKRSKIYRDLTKAQHILDQDHYGLEKVKERILEYLAVQQRTKQSKGSILCLVGPPGVGKTSVAQSIARATNRKYCRMALGGVRDEAEIRGHRRTYIGSMPGKVIQNIAKVGVRNPLFLFDEIDKMAQDFRGDPASALLEVLDPEQNVAFVDHYLEVEYDLSDVMFVCTANTLAIPDALRDRMEVIRLSGYTEDEKLKIAHDYLLPKVFKENGLDDTELTIESDAIVAIIRRYTREAGIRNLQREIAKIARKVVKNIMQQKLTNSVVVSADNLEDYLGVYIYQYGIAEDTDRIGQVTGLAWTEVGGELLTIETAVVPGKGKASYTGKLGDVMQESIQAATTVVRSRAYDWGIAADFMHNHDLHIHVPEGATPKDGPSAGAGMCTAIVSAITGIPVLANVAMTGEITLRGEVLAIGGLKEKLLAALRGGIDTVLIPQDNVKDLKEIPDNIKTCLTIVPVRWITQVFEHALTTMPAPVDDDGKAITSNQGGYQHSNSKQDRQ